MGLARRLAPRPRLLLCDEPVSALDLPNRHALIDRLRAVQRAEAIPVLYVTHSPAEAIALGTRLFLLERRQDRRRGAAARRALERPRPRRSIHLEGVRNTFPARRRGSFAAITARPGCGSTAARSLIVPFLDQPPGTPVVVEVRADDILLARGPVEGLSARNLIAGVVERVVPHGAEAEVVVRTGGVAWIVSVVAPAVEQLALVAGRRRPHDHQGEKLSCEHAAGWLRGRRSGIPNCLAFSLDSAVSGTTIKPNLRNQISGGGRVEEPLGGEILIARWRQPRVTIVATGREPSPVGATSRPGPAR